MVPQRSNISPLWCHHATFFDVVPSKHVSTQTTNEGIYKKELWFGRTTNALHGFRSSSKHFLSKYRDASTRSPFPHLFFFLFSTLTKKVNKFINPLIFSISFLFLLASNKQWPILYLVSKEPTLL